MIYYKFNRKTKKRLKKSIITPVLKSGGFKSKDLRIKRFDSITDVIRYSFEVDFL